MGCVLSSLADSSQPKNEHGEEGAQQGGGEAPSPAPATSIEKATSTGIDWDLHRARQAETAKVKLLLLGAGESGKSTILKQLRLLHGAPRSDDELRLHGVVVRSNIIVAIRKLCMHLRQLKLEAQLAQEEQVPHRIQQQQQQQQPRNITLTPKQAYDILMAHLVDLTATDNCTYTIASDNHQNNDNNNNNDDNNNNDNKVIKDWVGHCPRAGRAANNDAQQFLQLWPLIQIVWETKTMKRVWARRAAVNVIDSHKDFLQDLPRIAAPTFCPTTKDILLARVKTTHVIMERYTIDGIDFEVFDVGGQRSQRRKWIDCFDHVTAVIFVAALSGYDQTLAESKRTNRLVEALDLFQSVCNHPAFAKKSILLFLNKKDVFAEKIQYSHIDAQLPFQDYAGPRRDFDAGVEYFIRLFKERRIQDDFSDAFIHVTCATDTDNMEFVLDTVRTIIITENLVSTLALRD